MNNGGMPDELLETAATMLAANGSSHDGHNAPLPQMAAESSACAHPSPLADCPGRAR